MTQTNELITLINCEREDKNLPPLTFNPALTRAAITQSLHMFKTGTLSHMGANGSHFSDRINNSQYIFCEAAENIAYCSFTAIDVFDIWMQSTLHRDNLLNQNFRDIGVGLAPRVREKNRVISTYWTVTLAAPLYFEDMEDTDIEDLG